MTTLATPQTGGLVMRVEFDNCLEYEGPVNGGDKREIEVNAFGKPRLI